MNYLKRKIIARFVVFLTVVMVVFWSVPCNFAFGEVQEGSALTDTPESEQSETTDITTEVTVETTEESTDETIEETATETTDESSDSEESQEGEESQENEKAAEEEPATEETEETVSDSTGIEATLLPDTTLPVITIIGGSPVMVEPGSVFVDAGATAIDDVDGDLTGCVEVISTVDAAVPGSYKVTYNVSDAAGNAAAEVTRIVNVAGKPTVATDKDDYSPGEIVVVTGSGWLPGETIKLDFAILPLQLTLTYYATADGEGNIYNNEYMIFEHHLGQTIVLTATGQTTGLSAVTIFTDSPKIGSVTVGTQSPIAVYPTANATFTITVRRGSGTGSSGAFTANLSILTVLPPGCTASFNPTVVSFTSGNTSKTSTLTISTTSGSTPIGISSFTVKAEVSGTPADYATGDGTLKVGGVASVTAGSQTPNPVYTPNSTAYAVTVNRGGGTGPFSADLSVTTALPDGCTYSFSPSTVSFSSGDTSKTSTLTVSTSSFTPAGSTSFTIRATNSDNSNDYKTRSRTLVVASYTETPQIGSVTVGSQSPNAVYPTANASYTITITRGTGKGSFYADLSVITPLPDGCTASFSSSHIYISSTKNSATSTLTIITTSGSTPIGSTSFTVKAENSAYSADYATGDGTLKVGGVASVTAGSQTPNPVYASNSTTYAVTVNRDGGTGPFSADLSITTSLPSGCTYSFSPSTVSFSSGDTSKTSTLTVSTSSFTPAGSASFTIRATNSDNSNDYKTGSRTLAVVRDTTAPKVTLTAYLPDPTTDNTPFYSGSAADTYTNIVDIGYCIDSGSWANVDAFTPAKNVSFTFTTPALTDGLHTIYVRAYDAAGNISATVSDILTVNTPPTITGQPSDATKTIGESVTFSVAASGTAPLSYQWRKCGDNISGATSSSYTIPSVVPGDAGSYDVVVSNPYGSVTSNTAALTVNPITTTLSVSPVSGTYGGTVDLSATLSLAVSGKTISFTLNGTSAGSAITDASGVATLSGISLSGIDAGLYPAGVSTSFADDSNYIASSDSDSLTVTPALLTITANDASKAYGSPNPAFSATYSGFVAGDDESDLNGSLSITTPAGDTSPVGTYPITPSRLSSDNYNITFVDGTLIITAVTAAVTDTDNPDSKLEEENIVEVSGETSDINVQALTITADDDSDENLLDYTIAVNNKTLITTADLTADDEAEPTITVAGITSSGAIEVSEFTRLSPIILISGFCIVAIGLIVLFIHLSRMMKPRKLVIFWLKMMR